MGLEEQRIRRELTVAVIAEDRKDTGSVGMVAFVPVEEGEVGDGVDEHAGRTAEERRDDWHWLGGVQPAVGLLDGFMFVFGIIGGRRACANADEAIERVISRDGPCRRW